MTPHGVVLTPIAGLRDKVDFAEKLAAKEKIFKELVEIKGSITNLNHEIKAIQEETLAAISELTHHSSDPLCTKLSNSRFISSCHALI